MLTEQRHELILKLLEENGSIEVTEVKDLLDASESTVRRDITALDKAGKLTKVFGGAYHFTKGFFGTNGITKKSGCTTPDANEAMIKQTAMGQCKTCYVVCDSSKFDRVSSVTFAPFYETVFLTEKTVCGYEDCENIIITS